MNSNKITSLFLVVLFIFQLSTISTLANTDNARTVKDFHDIYYQIEDLLVELKPLIEKGEIAVDDGNINSGVFFEWCISLQFLLAELDAVKDTTNTWIPSNINEKNDLLILYLRDWQNLSRFRQLAEDIRLMKDWLKKEISKK